MEKCSFCGREIQYFRSTEGSIKVNIKKPCQCLLEKRKKEVKVIDETNEQLQISQIYNNSSLKFYKDYTFERFSEESEKQRNILTFAKSYTETFEKRMKDGMGFIISGEKGNGKTHITAAIANDLAAKKYKVIFENVSYLYSKIRSLYTKDSEATEIEFIENLCNADLLVLDDLGANEWKSKDAEKLYIVIDQRILRNKPIIASTNLNEQGLYDLLGERAYNRLKVKTVNYNNSCESYREKIVKETMERNSQFDGNWESFKGGN